jgi:hypothetical protein
VDVAAEDEAGLLAFDEGADDGAADVLTAGKSVTRRCLRRRVNPCLDLQEAERRDDAASDRVGEIGDEPGTEA